jgi:D-alanyl-D-alanine carboxypeptidase (penicillin-binding protein 5/6)
VAAAVAAVLCVPAVAAALVAPSGTPPPQGPPPTPVPPLGSPSPFPQSLDTPAPTRAAPAVGAAGAILINARTGQVLYAKEPDVARPIASLTKVMTAVIAVRARPPSHLVTVADEATHQTGSVLGLAAGERITTESLLYALLLQSANDAATALADDISGTSASFVDRMNVLARQLGLGETRFESPNGLDDGGHSSPRDLAALTRVAIANDELVRIMDTKFAVLSNPNGPARRIQNRNAMLWLYPGAFGVKTGYTAGAGQCLIVAAERGERVLISVVLADGHRVFDDSATLLDYGFGAFTRVAVVRAGQRTGSLTLDGAEVPTRATGGLVRLVRTDRLREFQIDLAPAPRASLPVAAGRRVGEAVISAHGTVLGRVPVVAAASVARPVAIPTPSPSPTPPLPPETRPLEPAASPAGALDLLASLLRATFGAVM